MNTLLERNIQKKNFSILFVLSSNVSLRTSKETLIVRQRHHRMKQEQNTEFSLLYCTTSPPLQRLLQAGVPEGFRGETQA